MSREPECRAGDLPQRLLKFADLTKSAPALDRGYKMAQEQSLETECEETLCCVLIKKPHVTSLERRHIATRRLARYYSAYRLGPGES